MPRRKKRKTYLVPVALEWELRIPADSKEQAIEFAKGRLNVITSFGPNKDKRGKLGPKDKVRVEG